MQDVITILRCDTIKACNQGLACLACPVKLAMKISCHESSEESQSYFYKSLVRLSIQEIKLDNLRSWDPKEFQRFSKLWGSSRIIQYPQGSLEISWNLLGSLVIVWQVFGSSGIIKDLPASFVTLLNLPESSRIFQNLFGSSGNFWTLLASPKMFWTHFGIFLDFLGSSRNF